MKVTISDVARLAGVSTATVSHTINSTRYVSGETKEKVYRAIAELGYTPDVQKPYGIQYNTNDFPSNSKTSILPHL